MVDQWPIEVRPPGSVMEASEVQQIMTQLGDPITKEQAEAMVREVDSNHDQRVQFSELLNIMHHA